MEVDYKRPNDRLSITYKGEQRELFMSFLRKNSLMRVLGSPDALPTMMLDPNISEMSLQVLLAEGGGAGKFADVELNENDLSEEDADAILKWASDHMAYFFLMRFRQLGSQAKDLEPLVMSLKSSLTGSQGSSSSEVSAGLSI